MDAQVDGQRGGLTGNVEVDGDGNVEVDGDGNVEVDGQRGRLTVTWCKLQRRRSSSMCHVAVAVKVHVQDQVHDYD